MKRCLSSPRIPTSNLSSSAKTSKMKYKLIYNGIKICWLSPIFYFWRKKTSTYPNSQLLQNYLAHFNLLTLILKMSRTLLTFPMNTSTNLWCHSLMFVDLKMSLNRPIKLILSIKWWKKLISSTSALFNVRNQKLCLKWKFKYLQDLNKLS